jgi:hypothetical protein
VTDNNVVIIPHPPYLLDLGPCDFTLFPKFKMKLNGGRFETVSDIRKESKVIENSIKENDFHHAFEVWKNDGIAAYVPKETGSFPFTLYIVPVRKEYEEQGHSIQDVTLK